jgi:hypothetical protein
VTASSSAGRPRHSRAASWLSTSQRGAATCFSDPPASPMTRPSRAASPASSPSTTRARAASPMRCTTRRSTPTTRRPMASVRRYW